MTKNLYSKKIKIKEQEFVCRLLKKNEWDKLQPLVLELNEHMSEALFKERLGQIRECNNYECVGILNSIGDLVACLGIWRLVKFYAGLHLEVDNVAVLPAYRNDGLGTHMMNWVEEYAITNHCTAIELNAYAGNHKAHKFYFKEGYKILGFHFNKILSNTFQKEK